MKIIIEMAREAGLEEMWELTPRFIGRLEAFAALVRSDERERLTDAAMKAAETAVDTAMALEREACAKVCEARGVQFYSFSEVAGECYGLAKAIRARGNT